MQDWAAESQKIVAGPAHRASDLKGYRSANADMIRRALEGRGPHSTHTFPEFGMRVAYNISSAHIPAVIAAGPAANTPYQNRYDRARILGQPPPKRVPLRERIDKAVAEVAGSRQAGIKPSDIYYGSLELNGGGVRFFGDVAMILKREHVDSDTLVLFRNSYDLSCSPVRADVVVPGDPDRSHAKAVTKLSEWAGWWPCDPPEMGICKLLDDGRATTRRMTIGMISAGLLEDEDYIEVARRGSFGRDELQELRLAAADAAAEARIADRMRNGPKPSIAELQWRHRRRAAERAASAKGLKARVVVTLGRDKG